VIAFRARHTESAAEVEDTDLENKPDRESAVFAGARPDPDRVVQTPIRGRKIEWLRNAITETARQHAADYSFGDGVRSLARLAPFVGYAADFRRVSVAALLHQQKAWFLVHSGLSASAAREAHLARVLWKIAYYESDNEREYARGFVQSALIGSHALLLGRRPNEALRLLDLADHAVDAIGAGRGSDHFRQRGVAWFQLREDDRAAEAFRKSAEMMERMHEARVPAQVLMTSARHTNLLGKPKWDGSMDVFSAADRSFGPGSLEASMALNWAAACALSTDSPSVAGESVDLLRKSSLPAPQLGHQTTIRKLLAITPDLGLDERLRRAWVRRALYENAFRAR
jgi:hypothetical protein